ncbi:glycoside hydrolase [Vararia minispora EC-137]|uniref:Glycoside hydrolase n=1 Tax=Vararia minispora EC-137 TaxID=1314806 RepID=A0ACB8Q6H3_9AGAM|nr:glycoside hydrolase [Vararia minispora EC-137]
MSSNTRPKSVFTLDVYPDAPIAEVSPLIYSGFIEHLGRCIYGGILPARDTDWPHTARNPCPSEKFVATPPELVSPEGFRVDVLNCIRDELRVPMIRWPGGNYVATYHWLDGVGPQAERRKRPDLAWGGEEPNSFGTDEFIQWCRAAKCEPYLCFNMGTGTLDEALNWVEYCNGTGDTCYASLRRKNTGREEPHNVKYWGIGNEVWGPWIVRQQSAQEYAATCRQWAHALKLIDPNIVLVSCGKTGLDEWDNVILRNVCDKVQLHSVHLYTSFGPRDRSSKLSEYNRAVYGPAAAEHSIEIARRIIDKACVEHVARTSNEPSIVPAENIVPKVRIAFDEWGVWDESIGTPQNGLEQPYDLKDGLAFGAWLNVFIRQASTVTLACLAQSVNVISPLVVRPKGILRHPTYHVLRLYSNFMRDGISVPVHIGGSAPVYAGDTLPVWTSLARGAQNVLDASAVLCPSAEGRKSLRIAVVNRDLEAAFEHVPIRIAFRDVLPATVQVYEVWHDDAFARNGWGEEGGPMQDNVVTKTWSEQWTGVYTFKPHSFTLLVVEVA